MLLLPYWLDVRLTRIPIITISISCICVAVYLVLASNQHQIIKRANWFCADQAANYPKGVASTTFRFGAEVHSCESLMAIIHSSGNSEVAASFIANELLRYKQQESALRVVELYRGFSANAPKDLLRLLGLNTWRFDPAGVLTNTFVHKDLKHLAYNLIFFLFFVPALELFMGRTRFLGTVLMLTLITTTVIYVGHWLTGGLKIYYGLSGLVSVCLGLFMGLLGHVQIRFAGWSGTRFGTLWLPASLIIAALMCWELISIITSANPTTSNITHITGFLLGIATARFWFQSQRRGKQWRIDNGLDQSTVNISVNKITLPTDGPELIFAIVVAGSLLAFAYHFRAPLISLVLSLPAIALTRHIYRMNKSIP